MSEGRVLLVDEDPEIRRAAAAALTAQKYEVVEAKSGSEALRLFRPTLYDLIILGCDIPEGVETCRKVRECGSHVALIVITNGSAVLTPVFALEAGADACIAKPFAMPELVARVQALLRRTGLFPFCGRAQLRLGDLEIDFKTRGVWVGGNEVRLAPKEFGILAYLAAHPNRIVTHRELIQTIFTLEPGDMRGSLRALVHHVRSKIERSSNTPPYIFTQPRVGYGIEMPELA